MKTVLGYLQRRIDELKEQEKQYLANRHERYARYAKEDLKEFENAVKKLTIPDVVGRSEQLFCSMVGKGFCPYEYENGKCKVEGKCTNHTTK